MVRGEQRFTCMLRTGEAMSARDLVQGLTNNRAGVASLRARHRPGHCELGGRTQMETRPRSRSLTGWRRWWPSHRDSSRSFATTSVQSCPASGIRDWPRVSAL